MALHEKKDFAKLCGLTTGNLTNYIKRKKVVMSGDYIDDAIPLNKEFLNLRKESLRVKAPAQDENKPEKTLRLLKPDPLPPGTPLVEEPDYGDDDDDGDENLDEETGVILQKKKIKAEIQYKKKQTEILRLKIEKLHGEVIPTELVKMIFSQHTKSIIIEVKNALDAHITLLAKRYNLNTNEIAELRGKIIETANNAAAKSVETSKKNINNIISQFADKKEVGEREP